MFRRQRDLLVPKIRALGRTVRANRPIDDSDILSVTIEVQDVLRKTRPAAERIFRQRISAALRSGGTLNGGLTQFRAAIDFTLFNPAATEFLEHHLPNLQGQIERETMERVSRVVRRGIEQGRSIQESAADVQELFTGMSRARAETIAWTETGIAASSGDFLRARSSSLDLVKIWSNSRDGLVRPSHQIREARELDAPFSNGLMYPLDPGGPAAEIVHCRCNALYVPRDELANWDAGPVGGSAPTPPPDDVPPPVFAPARRVKDAEKYAHDALGVAADYGRGRGALEVANRVNEGLTQLYTAGAPMVTQVRAIPAAEAQRIFRAAASEIEQYPAAYAHATDTLYLNLGSSMWSGGAAEAKRIVESSHRAGWHSSSHIHRTIHHEGGHAANFKNAPDQYRATFTAYGAEWPQAREAAREVSRYAETNPHEFVAEVFAGIMNGTTYSEAVMAWYKHYGGFIPNTGFTR